MNNQQQVLDSRMIANALIFLDRVDIKGFTEASALLQLQQALNQLANEQQILQTSPAIEQSL